MTAIDGIVTFVIGDLEGKKEVSVNILLNKHTA